MDGNSVKEGVKRVEEIRANDAVWSYNVNSNVRAMKKVLRTFKHYQNHIIYLHIKGDVIKTTAEHPFWIKEKGWTLADHIRCGDLLTTISGSDLAVDLVEIVNVEEPVFVYNFEVEDWCGTADCGR